MYQRLPVNPLIRFFIFLFCLALPWSVFADKKPFTGVFEGQGRGCNGKLFVKTKTIEWHTEFSACKSTRYTILEQDFTTKSPHIAYLLEKPSNACRFQVIEVSFDPEYPTYWNIIGYQSLKDFHNKSDSSVDALSCSAWALKGSQLKGF